MSSSKLTPNKSKPALQHDSNSEGSEIESENHLSQGNDTDDNPHETDLFSFLSAMHLSGGANGNLGGQMHPVAAQVLASRKRKFLDQNAHLGSGSGSGKLFGGMRPPGQQRHSEEEAPLHTPQCSQSGELKTSVQLNIFEGVSEHVSLFYC